MRLAASPVYDKAGNMIKAVQFELSEVAMHLTYDAWSRLVLAEHKDGSSAKLVAEYRYNGLGWRTLKRSDTSSTSIDGVFDEERRFSYSSSWQLLEEEIDLTPSNGQDNTDRRAHQVWGLRYIDDAVLRTIDSTVSGNYAATSAYWYLTDAQFSVVAMIAPDNGSLGYAHPVERLAYDPYGRLLGSAYSAYASHQWWRDFNCDGTVGNTTDPGDDLGMLVNAANTPSE